MSPTIYRHKKFRFFFFSREEKRMHVHVTCPDGEVKFWLEPVVALAYNYGLSGKELKELQKIIEEQNHVFTKAWKTHFKG